MILLKLAKRSKGFYNEYYMKAGSCIKPTYMRMRTSGCLYNKLRLDHDGLRGFTPVILVRGRVPAGLLSDGG